MASFISRQSSYGRPAEAPYVDQPIEMMAAAERAPAQAKGIAQQAIGDVLNLKSDALQVHEGEYNAIKGEYVQKANELADELSKGINPETIGKLKQLRRQADFDLSAEGRLGKMQSAYNQKAAWEKELDAEVAKYNESGGTKGISPDVADKKFQMAEFNLNNWYSSKGLTDKDVPLPKLVGTVDVEGLAYDLAQKLPTMKTDDYNKWAEQNGLATINSQVFQQIKGEKEGNIYSVDSKGKQYLDPDKINRVVTGFLSNDPKVQTYLDDEADINIYGMLSSDLSVSPNEIQDQVKAQYKQLYPQLKDSLVQKRVGEVAKRARDAFSTMSKTQTDKLHTSTTPKWGMGFEQDSAGQQFTLPITNSLGQVDDKINIEASLSPTEKGNLYIDGKLVGAIKEVSENPNQKTKTFTTTDGKQYTQAISGGKYSVEKLTPEQQNKKLVELQRKYPEIAAFSKGKDDFVKNIKHALREKDGQEGYEYNITLPEKVIVSKYLGNAANSLNPLVLDSNGKPTEEKATTEDLKNIKQSSFRLNPVTGKFTSSTGDKNYTLDIPDQFRNLIQPTKDLYAAGQRAWATGKPQSYTTNTNKTVTIFRELNPKTKQYDLKYYDAAFGSDKGDFTLMLNAQAESDQGAIYEKLSKKDLFYESGSESETETSSETEE